MRRLLPLALAACFMIFSSSLAPAQGDKDKKQKKGKFDPPDAFQPTEPELAKIKALTKQLADKIGELRKNPKTHELLPDVEIYHRGAVNIVRFKEFYSKDSVKWTLAALERGMERAEQLADGKTPWTTLQKRNVLRAYRSDIDGTAQPYGVTYPLDYGKDPKRQWRVDIVLHGRNGSLTEVAFLQQHNGSKKVAKDQDWVQVDIFGRGNNAYRWAGEADVIHAMGAYFLGESRAKRDFFDPGDLAKNLVHYRPVLRGFSMGGAGTWHLGLRRPDYWSVMGPGAGFTTTHNYAWKGKAELPDYQEKCLRIYDALAYAENAREIPIVAYSGGDDPQKLAADNIENRLRELQIKDKMTHLVKPGVGHKFDADYFQKANALWAKHAAEGRPWFPWGVSFATYSTMSASCNGITIVAMERQYERASVEGGKGFLADEQDLKKGNIRWEYSLTTKNVRWLRVDWILNDRPLILDGQRFNKIEKADLLDGAWFVKKEGRWTNVKFDDIRKEAAKGTSKYAGMQGPIDHAFMSDFVCVAGTGATWHPATQKFVDAKLKAFEYDWAKHWRGELPLTNEYGISPNEIKEKHLILFGDPSSNFLLANILPQLPLKWTKDEIEFAGQKYKASEHVPVMIFPNPLNPSKYVVLNTGHTIPSEDYAKTNALLYPRLGDYAILRMTGKGAGYEVATAGLFDEFWRVEKK